MANTFKKIQTVTVGSGGAASIDFTSIPQTYTDLKIVISAREDNAGGGGGTCYIQFNGDTGSNYSWRRLNGNGSTASTSRSSNQSEILAGDFNTTSNTTTIIQINNYSNSTTYKTVLIRSGYAASIVFANVGLWRNTAAITSVTMFTSPGNFSTGCTFTLYGIKAE